MQETASEVMHNPRYESAPSFNTQQLEEEMAKDRYLQIITKKSV